MFNIHFEFVLFALTLISVALFHRHTMKVALVGLVSIVFWKLFFVSEFSFKAHLLSEWMTLLNLLGLLFGFAILAKYFEESRLPQKIPHYLPDGKWGAFSLLAIIFILSSFLDNIAAAMIGGTVAFVVFRKKLHLGYLAAIIAASNAGGSGSVVGDTTTTLMWIDGVSPLDVLHAYVAAFTALFIFGYFASRDQDKFAPISKENLGHHEVDKMRLFIVALILILTIATNYALDFPALGVWIAIFIGHFLRKAPFKEVKNALPGTIFLLSLVFSASLMPVETLPKASALSTFILGFISAVFDNIPLTKLCLAQGGYDWGMVAYAVGFGGSMIWFGSSAGVALSNMFPELKSTFHYMKKAWYVSLAYVLGFFVLFFTLGFNPHPPHKNFSTSNKTHFSP